MIKSKQIITEGGKMEDLKILLFALYSNCETKEESEQLEYNINKVTYECLCKRIKELEKGKEKNELELFFKFINK